MRVELPITLMDQNDLGGEVQVMLEACERAILVYLPNPDGSQRASVLVEVMDGKLQLAAWNDTVTEGDDPTMTHRLSQVNLSDGDV